MTRTNVVGLLALAFVFALVTGCGQSVTILSIHDARLPADSRRWIADAEDGVAVATALRDRAETELDETRRWRTRLLRGADWQGGGGQAKALLGQVADARVALADMMLDHAELALDLALAKQRKINAETAMRHDLSVYDLEPIREDADRVRARLKEMEVAIDDHRRRLEELTTQWWQSYASYMQTSPNNSVMWIEPGR